MRSWTPGPRTTGTLAAQAVSQPRATCMVNWLAGPGRQKGACYTIHSSASSSGWPSVAGGLLSRKVAWRQEEATLERPYSLTYNPWTLANSWALAIIYHTDMETKSRFMGLEVLNPQCPPPYDCPQSHFRDFPSSTDLNWRDPRSQ